MWWWWLACGGDDPKAHTGETDTDTDADTDSDTDADTDADTDTDTDTDPGHTGDPGPCPVAADAVGDAGWRGALEVTGGPWCGAFDESRTLEEELARKVRLHLPPGTYPLPDVAGAFPFRLPVCLETADGLAAGLRMGDPGEVTATVTPVGGTDYFGWNTTQPLRDDRGRDAGTFHLWSQAEAPTGTAPDPLVLDGRNESAYRMEPAWMSTCDPGPYCLGTSFVPCEPRGFDEQHHEIAFDGGEIDLRLDIGGSYASTEPAAFRRAHGTLDGVAFDETDYFRLIYNPEHHHFQRHFAVLFAAPIGGACGLAVREVLSSPSVLRVERVNCDLSVIDTRAVLSEQWLP